MAGTLFYRLQVDHVYQRRFTDPTAFATALRNSHWYIITRRPSIRIIEESVQLDDRMLTVDFVTRETPVTPEQIRTYGTDFYAMGELRNFQVYEDGAYFSIEIGGDFMHGDAWALASFLSHADTDIARQEVLYVGQAFGPNGESNAWTRTEEHKKLQKIYADHVNADCEIFIAPLSLEQGKMVSDDHIDDSEDGPSLETYYSNFRTTDGRLLKPSVNLIEHALIAYFDAPYNEKLREWRADQPTEDMKKMRSAGFRLVQVHLSGWWGLARFYSSQEPEGSRSHFISHDLPQNPLTSIRRGISAPEISDWRFGARLAREGKQIFADRSEEAAVLLRAFGDEAPVDRKPVDVVLRRGVPNEPSAEQRADTHSELRESLSKHREERKRITEPIPWSGRPSYDPDTGTIAVGEYLSDGEPVRIQLHEPNSQEVYSGLIIGDQGSGKSNSLRIIAAEAAMSGKFLVLPILLGGGGHKKFLEFWAAIARYDRFIATTQDKAIEILSLARHIADERLQAEYPAGDGASPGVIVVIDNSDSLLQQELGARLVIDILQRGGPAAVGIIQTVSDISALTGNSDLMYELVRCQTQQAFMPNGYDLLAFLTAVHGDQREETWRDAAATFILHRDTARTSLGILIASIPRKATPGEAQKWCRDRLSA
jgi:hypothetical protein